MRITKGPSGPPGVLPHMPAFRFLPMNSLQLPRPPPGCDQNVGVQQQHVIAHLFCSHHRPDSRIIARGKSAHLKRVGNYGGPTLPPELFLWREKLSPTELSSDPLSTTTTPRRGERFRLSSSASECRHATARSAVRKFTMINRRNIYIPKANKTKLQLRHMPSDPVQRQNIPQKIC